MPDTIFNIEAETAERKKLAKKLRHAADELERDGLNSIRHWDARGICLAALNDLDRALDYGRPGAGIDELLGVNSHG